MQLTLDDQGCFTAPSDWSVETKTPSTLLHAMCPVCGRKPPTLDPHPEGWCWDTMEPTNPWIWCPTCDTAEIWTGETNV